MIGRVAMLAAALSAISTAQAADQMAPHTDAHAARALMRGEPQILSNIGKVSEVHATGNYVYIRAEQPEGHTWLAAPRQPVAVGAEVRWGEGVVMQDFKSHQLGSFFHKLIFVDRIEVAAPK